MFLESESKESIMTKYVLILNDYLASNDVSS